MTTPRRFLVGLARLTEAGVHTWLQFRCLSVAADTPGATTTQIAGALGASLSGVHLSLVTLEGLRLLKVEQTKGKGKPSNAYSLTEKGRALFSQLSAAA